MKKLGSLLFVSLFITACSSNETIPTMNIVQDQVAVSSTTSKSINPEFAKIVAESLDLNKDGNVDATEVPMSISTKDYEKTTHNSDGSSLTGYVPTKAISVTAITEALSSGSSLSVYGSKISEKNKDKIVSSLANALVKDPIAEKNKVYGYATTIGYFTAKTTIMVRNMDASLLAKRINEQLTIGKGTINGVPYKGANGSINVLSSYVTIDDKYKARLHFSDYDSFESGIQLIGSHKITDAAKKIVK